MGAKMTAVLIFIGILVDTGVLAYRLDRDLDSVMDRAQVAADASDMLGYTRTLAANMRTYGVTSGHTALLLTNPRNDLALEYQAVQRLVERLEQIQGLPKDDVAYQTALDDMRGIVREMPRLRDGVLWVRRWWVAVLLLVAWFRLQLLD
jgi:CHASE3 domain sensor protein